MLNIQGWTVGLLAENPYLLTCTETNDAVLVDPGDDGPLLLTRVYPGHGPATTIGDEKRYNPFTQGYVNT